MEQASVFKRKIYQDMLKWKEERNGETALLIEGDESDTVKRNIIPIYMVPLLP